MEFGIEILQQGLVFLFTFTTTLVVLSRPDDFAAPRSIRDGLRNIMETFRRKVEPAEDTPRPRHRLSDETWQRVLHVHMINAAPDRRM